MSSRTAVSRPSRSQICPELELPFDVIACVEEQREWDTYGQFQRAWYPRSTSRSTSTESRQRCGASRGRSQRHSLGSCRQSEAPAEAAGQDLTDGGVWQTVCAWCRIPRSAGKLKLPTLLSVPRLRRSKKRPQKGVHPLPAPSESTFADAGVQTCSQEGGTAESTCRTDSGAGASSGESGVASSAWNAEHVPEAGAVDSYAAESDDDVEYAADSAKRGRSRPSRRLVYRRLPPPSGNSIIVDTSVFERGFGNTTDDVA